MAQTGYEAPNPGSGSTTSQKCEVVPRPARTKGSQTFVSLDSRLESNEEEQEEEAPHPQLPSEEGTT